MLCIYESKHGKAGKMQTILSGDRGSGLGESLTLSMNVATNQSVDIVSAN